MFHERRILAKLRNSICILTGVRIVEASRVDLHDLPYSSARSVMCSVPEPVLSLVVGCIPITVPLFRRAKKEISSGLLVTPSAPPSYESGVELLAVQKAARLLSDASKQKRLDKHLYPMGTFIDITSTRGSVAESPVRLLRRDTSVDDSGTGRGIRRSRDSSVTGRGMRRSRDYFGTESSMGDGITVLTELHVDSEKRVECASVI
jgi:hypothetical protein